jgi:hypothetical protein
MDIRPQAVAIPKSTEHLEKGKYGRALERAVRADKLEVLLEAA